MSTARSLAAAAAVAGLAYALSPLTVWLALIVALIARAAVRGIEGAELRWVSSILAAGVGVRLLAVAWLVWSTTPGHVNNPSFFGDGSYAIGRSLWLRSVWLGEAVHPRYFMEAFDHYGGGGHNYFHAALQTIIGPAPLALHLLAATIYLCGVVILFRLVRSSYGPVAAGVALAAMWLSPSWMAWSITPLKDAPQFTLVAIAIACVVRAVQRGARQRVLAAACVLAAVAALSTLRTGGSIMMVATVATGLLCSVIARWGTVAMAAIGAAVVVVVLLVPWTPVQARISSEVTAAANRHVGHVRTTGTYFKLLDDALYRLPQHETVVPTPIEATRFVIRAAVAFVTVPLPWQLENISGLLYLPLQLIWYVIVALAAVGLAPAFHRHPLLASMLVAYTLVSIAIIAPNSGNVGTLVRHRDWVVPFVVCLSGVGARALVARRRVHVPLVRRVFA
jgi:hypothetical protein